MPTSPTTPNSPVALLNCGDNLESLKVAQGLATKGYDLLLVCQPDLQDEANKFRQMTEQIGRQCTVVVRRITSLDFYRQLLAIIYFNFGWLNIYIDYATPITQKPTDDQAQLSATLLWMYLQFMPPVQRLSYSLVRSKS